MIVQNWEILHVLCRLETGFRVSANHAGAVGKHCSCRKNGRNLRNWDHVQGSRVDAAGERFHRKNDDHIPRRIFHAPMSCPGAVEEHLRCRRRARRLRIRICARRNHVGAVGARGDRQIVGRNLCKRYCVRENLGNAAGEHGRCRMCGRTPHTQDCELESREGAVVELGYSRRLCDRNNSQRPYCTTLVTLEGPTSFLCEETAARMNSCLTCKIRRWAACSV